MTAMESKKNKRSSRTVAINVLVHVILAILAVIWIMPIFWIVLTSF